jgi:outer membrane protein TolC
VPFSKTIITLLLSIPLSATTLPELIESGLHNNSLIKKSDLQIELMEAKKSESKAKRFGEFDVVGSYNHYNLPRTLAPIVPSALSPGSSVDTTQDLFSTGIQYSVPLFTGGAMERQVEIDSLAKEVGKSRRKLSREELIYNIRSLYLSALSLQELIASQEEYVNALEKLREVIATGVELGKKAKIELLKADNDLQGAKGQVMTTQSSLRMVKRTLESLTHISSIDTFEPIEVEVGSNLSDVNEEEMAKLERFKLQDLEIKKGEKMVKKVESLHLPQVGLNAYAGYSYDLDQVDPFESEQLWQVGLNLKWDVFDFGTTSAKIQQAKIAKLQALVAKEATTEGFKKLFAKAQNEIATAEANYLTNHSQYNLLQESERIEEARYDAGVATLNDLLLAKSKTALAESKMIQSKYAYQNGVFYLDYLLERGEQ